MNKIEIISNQISDQIGTLINKQQFTTRAQVAVASFIGGPITGCYLIGKNFNTMGNAKRATQWYIGGIVFTVLLMTLVICLPERYIHYLPNSIIPIVYITTLDNLYSQYQGKYIKQQIKAGDIKYSWWKVLGISLIGLVITGIVAFALAAIISFFL